MTFEDYVRLRGVSLVRLACLLTRDAQLAEDFVQEVLGHAYPRWARIVRADHPDLYVRKMLVNANLSRWRRRSSREVVEGTLRERSTAADHSVEFAERDALWRLIVALPRRQRAIVVLRYYEDLDDAAIAEILDCSPSTVRTHAMRALSALRDRVPVPVLSARVPGSVPGPVPGPSAVPEQLANPGRSVE
jgi:RNA polymerase sigma-70 factor (sigma-E family)